MPVLTYQALFDVPLPPQVPLINYGWVKEPDLPQPPSKPRPQPAAIFRGEDGNEFPLELLWRNAGWEVQPPQPPHRILKSPETGDSGTELQKGLFWANDGWEAQPPQPPHPKYRSPEIGDPGNELPKGLFWYNYGWEVQPPQPPHPKYRSPEVGDAGNQAPFPVPAWGWDVQLWQPPHPKYRSPEPGDPGSTEARLVALNYGFEIQPIQPPHIWRHNPETGDLGNELPFSVPAWGWEAQSWLLPHSWRHSPEFGDPGNEAPVVAGVAVPLNYGFEIQSFQPTPVINTAQRRAATKGSTAFAFYPPWVNHGWEVQSVQPPSAPKRGPASIFPKEDGTEAPYVFVAASTWAFDPLGYVPAHRFRDVSFADNSLQTFLWVNGGWEVQPWQPPSAAPTKKPAATFPKLDGIELPFVGPTVPLSWYGEPALFQPPSSGQRLGRLGGQAPKDDGIQWQYAKWINGGWEVQSPQPPHIWRHNPEPGDPGTQGIYIKWVNSGWEVQPPQPPYKPSSRPAAIVPKEDGTEAAFIPPVNVPSLWWGEPTLFQPPVPIGTPQRRSATRGKSEFAYSPKQTFPFTLPTYVEQIWQPHKVSNQFKYATFDRGSDAIEYPYQFWKNWGWEIQPPQPPYVKALGKGSTLVRGDDGTQAQLINWFNMGWEVQPWQPPHPKYRSPEDGDPDIDVPFNFITVSFNDWGWEVQPWQSVLLRSLRSAAIMPIAQGIEGVGSLIPFIVPLVFFEEDLPDIPHPRYRTPEFGDSGTQLITGGIAPNAGFEVQSFQPPYRRYNSPDIGEGGIEAPFFFSFPVALGATGWAVQEWQPPYPIRTGQRREATRGNTLFAFYPPWVSMGWEVQSVQPGHPRQIHHDPDEGELNVDLPLGLFQFNYGWEAGLPLFRAKPPHAPTVGDDVSYRFVPISIAPVPLVAWDVPTSFIYSRGRLLNQHIASLIENNALPFPPGTINAPNVKEWIIRARRRGRR